MRVVTDTDFEDVLTGGPVLVDFRADWCGPCRQLEPVLESLATRWSGRATIVQVDVDTNPRTVSRYAVTGLPTLILFSGGEPVHRVHGLRPEAALRAELDPWIA
ncbi:thioredoxin fold domain-containing protein [Actinoplanes bogorensis]|uniref:Thioredoxin n=1 Tax=Paractinoplanes bogorensis TaxID=1610840 RepID=A0ABS5YJY3_9ACTN|nr:thioredoxin domain-containing protein [Actinoplanes bogorensis]MBU2663631.1 thioredoxin fold domain-containing protein [Actinoplanes bogorensis]